MLTALLFIVGLGLMAAVLLRAYDPNELFQNVTTREMQKRVEAYAIQPKTFAGGTAKLPALTPVAYNTSTNLWVVWTDGGDNGTGTIKGFTWPDEIQLVDGKEVLGNVLMTGKIHFDDISLPTGESEANLKTACRSGLRDAGILIQGLDNVR